MSITEEPLEAWFKREVLSHDEPLTRFLLRLWGSEDELADLRQEAYTRVYEAACAVKPHSPKAFLFTIARHLITDRVRRARAVAFYPCADEDIFAQLIDEISPEQQAAADAELQQLSCAMDMLTPKSREVLWLRRVQDFSQRETAVHLGVSEKTVEKHLSTGLRRLTELMR